MGSIRSALIYSAASQYILKALSLISVIAVARLLTPAEVGVFAIASSLVLITGELKSLGAGTYLIRAEKLDDATIKSATGLMMLISWSMGGLLFFLSPWLAVFYQVPDLKIILRLLSYSFFLAPFISIPRALLTRDLKFKAIFYISIITQLTLLISTIIFILLGFSYFSLAYASVIGYTIELVLTLVFRPQGTPWLPAFTNLFRILKFGIYVTFGNLFAKFSLSLPDLIIGKQGTVAEVALFSRGVGFLDFVSNTLKQGITPIAMPYLSEQKRLGHPLEEPYLKATMLLGVIVWPALAVAGIVSSPIILLFFGPQWADTAPLVSILCLW
ncbi:MAG: oligosaccharide flippase family protein, partial [Spongiibacteraceae bacterium]